MRDILQQLLDLTRFEELGYATVEVKDREGELHTGTFYSDDLNLLLEEVYEILNTVTVNDVEFEVDFDSEILTDDDTEE